MAHITYILIEGTTETDEDIESFVSKVKEALKTQFAQREITIAIQDAFPDISGNENAKGMSSDPNLKGYT